MCGIVGFAGEISVKAEKAFADLLIMNQLRGFDSVGVAKVGYNRIPEVVKDICSPVDFLVSKEYGLMMKGLCNVLIGHNRAATQGTITVENAHPFTHDHITGVHNGTLLSRYQLEEAARFPVDSDNLYYHMAKHGVKDLWQKLNGAASLVWWDAKEMTLNFLRNKERPMYMAWNKERTLLMWASEFYMLQAACYRQGIVLAAAPVATEVDMHYSFQLNHKFKHGHKLEMHTEKLEPYTFPVYTSFYGTGNYRSAYAQRYNKPEWLVVGKDVDVLFDQKALNTSGQWEYGGFSPHDDRVTYTYVQPSSLKDNVYELAPSGGVYEAMILSLTTCWIKGNPEWDVRIGAPRKKSEAAVKKMLEDKAKKEEVAAFLEAMEDEWPPFDAAATGCTKCHVKSTRICNMCKASAGLRRGSWTMEHGNEHYCHWCGVEHHSRELIYMVNTKDECYCMDCFDHVVKYLFDRNVTKMN